MGYLLNKKIILFVTAVPALLDIFGCDLIRDFFKSEIVLDSHSDSYLVAHCDVAELMRKVIAAVYAHHLLAFLGAVRFY